MNSGHLPNHIAIIMDGNGRWAKKRMQPRIFGHRSGTKSVRRTVTFCIKHGIPVLTLFAFSTENWSRPKDEVSMLMELFIKTIRSELDSLHKNQVKLQVIGDVQSLPKPLIESIEHATETTQHNQGLCLNIAANYGGRWDILNAVNQILARATPDNPISKISEMSLNQYLSLSNMPDPDLYIRTGGERRISNFLLWQAAYSELYFTDTFWPDFDQKTLTEAIQYYQQRERRFGKISEQPSHE